METSYFPLHECDMYVALKATSSAAWSGYQLHDQAISCVIRLSAAWSGYQLRDQANNYFITFEL